MESAALDLLYKEFHSLISQYVVVHDRIKSISAAIVSYGGTVPTLSEINNENLTEILTGVSENMFPANGTWKEKILFALKRFNKPVTATEVHDYIRDTEKRINHRDVHGIENAITVTLSKMGMDNEIAVDRTNFKNKYFLKT